MADLLAVEDLSVAYRLASGPPLLALDGVDLTVSEGEIVGIVGESGCGKSTLGMSLIRLLPQNSQVVRGAINWRGKDLLKLSNRALRRVRGGEICMVFQDPYTTLNPAYRIGTQLLDLQRAHGVARSRRDALQRAGRVLAEVGIPDAPARLRMYPHEFSGGMRQRIAIAGALLLEPALLVADEPTSALDVTLEAQILELLVSLRERRGTAILLISHDLGVIAEVCDRVVVMYAGRVVEHASVFELFARPRHPYTQALLGATPSRQARGRRLAAIPGLVPHVTPGFSGCVFADRCPRVRAVCRVDAPALVDDAGSLVACHIYDPSSGYAESPPDAGPVDRAEAVA